jgi:hypothetical protein
MKKVKMTIFFCFYSQISKEKTKEKFGWKMRDILIMF